LPSITNKSLMQIARDLGYTVEERPIPLDELDSFDEVLAVGTAVVVTPVGSVTHRGTDGSTKVYEFGNHELGETTKTLYQRVRAIQNGEEEDVHGWNMKIDLD
jgi:branched-chain amino acid aminotransferase